MHVRTHKAYVLDATCKKLSIENPLSLWSPSIYHNWQWEALLW